MNSVSRESTRYKNWLFALHDNCAQTPAITTAAIRTFSTFLNHFSRHVFVAMRILQMAMMVLFLRALT